MAVPISRGLAFDHTEACKVFAIYRTALIVLFAPLVAVAGQPSRSEFSEAALRQRLSAAGLVASVEVSTEFDGRPRRVSISGQFAASSAEAAAISAARTLPKRRAATVAFVARWVEQYRSALGFHAAESLKVADSDDPLGMVYEVERRVGGAPLWNGSMLVTVRGDRIVQIMFGAASCTPEMLKSLQPDGRASSPPDVLSAEEVEKRVDELLPDDYRKGARYLLFREANGGKLVERLYLYATEDEPFLVYRVFSMMIYTLDARTGEVIGEPESRMHTRATSGLDVGV